MEFDLLIKGGTVVNHDREFLADVGVRDGKIVAVGDDLPVGSARVVDATGKFVMPGGIDPHCHMELPFMGTISKDDFFTGSRAALSGGTTMLIDFAIPGRGMSFMDIYSSYRERADAKCCMDYGLHMGISSWDETKREEMRSLVSEHGINSFKFFMAYKGALMVTDPEIVDILQLAKEVGAVAQVHCENGDMVEAGQKRLLQMGITAPAGHPMSRPPEVEAEATARVCRLAAFVGCPLYVVHVMSRNAMEEVSRAKMRGQRIIGETLCAAIALDDSHLYDEDWDHAVKYVMSPPLRPKGHQQAIKNGLRNRILDLVGSDHCVFDMEQRRMGRENFAKIPNGLNGIEDRMNVCWNELVNTGMISRKDFVRIMSTEAAQVFNIFPQKGFIGVGADADITIMDPAARRVISVENHHQNLDYNVFEGYELEGVFDTTISRGVVVWENGVLTTTRGAGRFVPMKPFGKMFDGMEREIAATAPSVLVKRKRQEHEAFCTLNQPPGKKQRTD